MSLSTKRKAAPLETAVEQKQEGYQATGGK